MNTACKVLRSGRVLSSGVKSSNVMPMSVTDALSSSNNCSISMVSRSNGRKTPSKTVSAGPLRSNATTTPSRWSANSATLAMNSDSNASEPSGSAACASANASKPVSRSSRRSIKRCFKAANSASIMAPWFAAPPNSASFCALLWFCPPA